MEIRDHVPGTPLIFLTSSAVSCHGSDRTASHIRGLFPVVPTELRLPLSFLSHLLAASEYSIKIIPTNVEFLLFGKDGALRGIRWRSHSLTELDPYLIPLSHGSSTYLVTQLSWHQPLHFTLKYLDTHWSEWRYASGSWICGATPNLLIQNIKKLIIEKLL